MRLFVFVVVVAMVVGCSSGRAPIVEPPAAEAPPAPVQPPEPPAQVQPTGPSVRASGTGLQITGLQRPWIRSWSPSGERALISDGAAFYLLDTTGPTLEPLSGFSSVFESEFWSETELLWSQEARRLYLRDLQTGTDRLLHDFGPTQAIHWLRPGDTHFVANYQKGVVQQGYRFGTIVAAKVGDSAATVLIETGHVIGRMADGQVLAVEGLRGGPLWSLAPTGEKRLLSQADAYFVQISPDGRRALWLTRPEPKTSWLHWLRPAVAHADPPYDPPLTDLWTWDGSTGEPVRTPLGGTFSARAEFSPDGSRIALALNPARVDELTPGTGPSSLAVVEDGTVRTLASFDGPVSIGIWLGSDGFRFMAPTGEKTGAQAPIMRIDMAGKESQFSQALWWAVGVPFTGEHLILDWRGDTSVVYWRGVAEPAQVGFSPNDRLGEPGYAPPGARYMPFSGNHGLWLKRLER